METPKIALLGKTLYEIQQIVANLRMPKFAAKQITSWLYDKKVDSIDEMTNLSLKHREALKEGYEVGASAPVEAMRSVDGTVKYLFRTPTNDYVYCTYDGEPIRFTAPLVAFFFGDVGAKKKACKKETHKVEFRALRSATNAPRRWIRAAF